MALERNTGNHGDTFSGCGCWEENISVGLLCGDLSQVVSQVVQNFEIILAAVFTKSSKTDVTCSEKVHISM